MMCRSFGRGYHVATQDHPKTDQVSMYIQRKTHERKGQSVTYSVMYVCITEYIEIANISIDSNNFQHLRISLQDLTLCQKSAQQIDVTKTKFTKAELLPHEKNGQINLIHFESSKDVTVD